MKNYTKQLDLDCIQNYLNDVSIFFPSSIKAALNNSNVSNIKHLGSRIYHINADESLKYGGTYTINQNQFFYVKKCLIFSDYQNTTPDNSLSSLATLSLFDSVLYKHGYVDQDLKLQPIIFSDMFFSSAQCYGTCSITLDVELFELTHVSSTFLQ